MARRYENEEDDHGQPSQLVRHVQEARLVDETRLGRRPTDLAEILARLALAAPGICSLRALGRVCGGPGSLTDTAVRNQALELSWGLRSLFNRPEIMTVLRAGEESGESYWNTVVDHCLDGNLQAVLDEYLHMLVESEGLQDTQGAERASGLAAAAAEALTIRSATNAVDDIKAKKGTISLHTQRARVHFAARFGRNQTEDRSVQREGQLRAAFNSPFWPFVLASTSVGQEGLDFHVYSHAVVHWNVPGNPVDFEQREGRVHRYKGHAIRRNVAAQFACMVLQAADDDPWHALFCAALQARPTGENDLVPFWIFAPEGGARIERYVPAMPLSRELARYRRLLRTVGAYRLLIGQPRHRAIPRSLTEVTWLR